MPGKAGWKWILIMIGEEQRTEAAPPPHDSTPSPTASAAPGPRRWHLTGTYLFIGAAIMYLASLAAGMVVDYLARRYGPWSDDMLFWLQELLSSLIVIAACLLILSRLDGGFSDAGLNFSRKKEHWGFTLVMFIVSVLAVLAVMMLVTKLGVFNYFSPETARQSGVGGRLDQGLAQGRQSASFVFMSLCLVLAAPLAEELCFRGMGMGGYLRSGSVVGAYLWTSIVFAVLHGLPRLPGSFVQGLVFAHIRRRTGSLPCSVLAHSLNNAMVVWVASYFT